MTITRRPETPADEPFLKQMIIASVADELYAWSWPEAMREPMLNMQYNGKVSSLRGNYPDATSEIILIDGQPAGWIYVDETPTRFHLCEIMVAIEHRSKGIGATVLRELLDTADRAAKPVTLLVFVNNPRAIQLYERLGFARTGGDEVQHEMTRPVSARA